MLCSFEVRIALKKLLVITNLHILKEIFDETVLQLSHSKWPWLASHKQIKQTCVSTKQTCVSTKKCWKIHLGHDALTLLCSKIQCTRRRIQFKDLLLFPLHLPVIWYSKCTSTSSVYISSYMIECVYINLCSPHLPVWYNVRVYQLVDILSPNVPVEQLFIIICAYMLSPLGDQLDIKRHYHVTAQIQIAIMHIQCIFFVPPVSFIVISLRGHSILYLAGQGFTG